MTPAEIIRLENLIESRDWQRYDGIYSNYSSIKDSLIDLFSILNKDQRSLIFDLLEDYFIMSDYSRSCRDLMRMIAEKIPKDTIFISPITDYDSVRTKSADAISYDLYVSGSAIDKERFKFRKDPSLVSNSKSNFHHVAVDDFIGSGNQFMDMIKYLKLKKSFHNITHVACIVIQEDGFEAIKSAGYDVIYIVKRRKAIKYLDPLKWLSEDAYRVYDSIETMIKCNPKYMRGYEQSEATVTMKSTPNNTLPIFWHSGGTKKWPAPFRRP